MIKKKYNKKNNLILTNLYVKCNIKNTLITLTKKNGNVLKQWSTKALKKTKLKKKNNTYNVQLIIYRINQYLKINRIKKINIYLKGIGIGKKNILKNLDKKIKIGYIFDKTPISFNGCRKKKIKRH